MAEAALTLMGRGRGIFPVIFKTPGDNTPGDNKDNSIIFWVTDIPEEDIKNHKVPAKSGSLGIWDGRRPVISSLEDEVVRLKTGAGWKAGFMYGAILEEYIDKDFFLSIEDVISITGRGTLLAGTVETFNSAQIEGSTGP